MMPALLLRKAVMDNWENGLMDSDIADSVDFIVEQACYCLRLILLKPANGHVVQFGIACFCRHIILTVFTFMYKCHRWSHCDFNPFPAKT